MRQRHEGAHRLVGKIDHRKAIGERDERRAAGRGRRCAHHRIEANRPVLPVLENVQFAALDVHPQQPPCRRVPTWPFRELRVGAYGDLHGRRIS